MATHDYNLANQDGASFRSDLNNALAAIVSNNSSSTAPATTFAHQIWVDTTANVIKQRNAANDAWVELWRIDGGFNAKTFSSNVTLNAQSDLRFADSDSSNWVAFQAPATVSSNVTWTLPSADGSADQALVTNGSGTLSWADAGGTTDNITEGNTSAEVVDTGSDGHFKVVTEGTEALRVDSSRRLLIGTNSAINVNGYTNANLLVAGAGDPSSINTARYDNNQYPNTINIAKSRGASVGTNTIVNNNDVIGQINFTGADGTAFVPAADISAEVDGTPGTNDMPGRLVFSTTADGASSPTERMRITNQGNVGIGLTSPKDKFDVNGPVLTSNALGSHQTSCGVFERNANITSIRCYGATAGTGYFRLNVAGGGGSADTNALEIDTSSNLKFNSGFGSVATAYGCRAWVNFNGTGTVAIREDGNVSSITDNGTGQYQINFTNAMPDTNYIMAANGNPTSTGFMLLADDQSSYQTTTALKVQCRTSAFVVNDNPNCQVAVFR